MDVKIPEHLFKEFSEPEITQNENSDSDSDSAKKSAVNIETFEHSITWIVQQADNYCKSNNLPGIDKLPPEQLSELITIVMRRNLSPEIFNKSPEFMLGSIAVGLLAQNVLALNKMKKEQSPENDG